MPISNYFWDLFVTELPRLTIGYKKLVSKYNAEGHPNQAREMEIAFDIFRLALITLEEEIAVKATETLIHEEKATRVRPDAEGNSPPPHLDEHLVAEPFGSVLWGTVGIGNEDILDKEVPWWTTNEEGSDANVGKHALIGVFQPGESKPDSDLFREHPIFEPRPKGTNRGSGMIENPIPARHFIAKTVELMIPVWKERAQEIIHQYAEEVLAIYARSVAETL